MHTTKNYKNKLSNFVNFLLLIYKNYIINKMAFFIFNYFINFLFSMFKLEIF